MRLLPRFMALALAGLGFTASAGTVEVAFVDPENFADAGNAAWEERENIEALGRHLQALGRQLPAGHALRIEVLDVDLAGSIRARGIGGVRTVNGRSDFPRMKLRYTLDVPGQPSRTDEEVLSDIDYARGLSAARSSQPLHYEKRMLGEWFARRFAPRLAQN
jgi:hypothetical protein